MPEFKFNLGWIHYRALMSDGRAEAMAFYELEACKNNWSGRELERQMGSLLFDRLARSKDKRGLIKLACKGQEIVKPEDAVKEPLVLEFLLCTGQKIMLWLYKPRIWCVARRYCFRDAVNTSL